MKTWTPTEVRILTENYNILPNSELDALFPNKSHNAVYKKAYSLGLRKEAEIEFKNRSEVRKREKGSNWKGGTRDTKHGYRQVLAPGHHRADAAGYVMEHILAWELATGVPVPKNCCIHHINGNKRDNRIQNLCMMDFGAHTTLHNVKRKEQRKKEMEA